MDKFKMKDDKYTRPEHQEILGEFTRVRDAYVALKAYCDSQEETLKTENERLERMKGNLERLSKVCLLLENRYKLIAEEMQTENATLRKTVQDLKEQCNHLRLIVADRNGDYEQTVRLQDEVEVLKGQLLLQEEKYRKDVASLNHRHSDEIQKYKVLLTNAKQNAVSVRNKKRGQTKDSNKSNKSTTCFRWPELDIEKTNSTSMDIEEEIEKNGTRNKKRKLFHEDNDTAINIV